MRLHHELRSIEGFEGLVECKVCGAAEGELLAYCPGFRLNSEALEASYRGNVTDLTYWLLTRRASV